MVFDATDKEVWSHIKKEGPYDIIIDTSGINKVIDQSLECLAGERSDEREMIRQGVLYLMGGRDKVEYTNMLTHPKEAILMHSSYHTRKEVYEALRLLKRGVLSIAPLITHHLSPEEASEIYQKLIERNPETLSVVFKWA